MAHAVHFEIRDLTGFSPHRLMTARRYAPRPARRPRDVNARATRKIRDFLIALRAAGRRSVFIIDKDCGDGQLLIDAARRARALGFVAIEAKGFDPSRELIDAAARSAAMVRDPAIGFSFGVRDRHCGLPLEDEEADLMLAGQGGGDEKEIARVTDRNGMVIRHW